MFLGCFFVGLSGLIIAEWVSMYRSQRDGILSEIRGTETGRVTFQKRALEMDLRMVTTDVRTLADHFAMSPFLTNGDGFSARALQEEFLAVSKTRGVYDRILVLDAEGREVVRVDYNGGHPAVVPAEKLADRRGLSYFTEGFRLDRGQVYMSRFDLNVKAGKRELPHKPTIRFATPLFDADGRKAGLLVLKFLGQSMLARIGHSSFGQSGGMSMLINTAGYWLRSPNLVDEWGFMFGNNRTFAARFPKANAIISRQVQGFCRTDEGLFFFRTVYPLAECRSSSASSARQPLQPGDLTDRYWKVISFVPRSVLEARLSAKARSLAWNGGLLILLLGLITVLLGGLRLHDERYFSQVRQGQAQLAEAHESLRMHAERTDRANAMLKCEIAERRRAEEALASSEEKFRVVYQSSAEAVILLDEKGFFDCNIATLKLFGCADRDEFCGKHPGDMSARVQPDGGDSKEVAARRIAAAMQSGNSRFEWVFRRTDGTEFLADVVLNALELDGRKVLQGVVRDIGAQRQARDDLARMLDKLRRFNRLAVGREQRMVELKKEVNEMARKAGISPPYEECLPTVGA